MSDSVFSHSHALAMTCDRLCKLAVAMCATAAAAASPSPDYDREARWAREVEPAVVVGEPVYLTTPPQPRVLALYTPAANAKGGVIVVHGLGVHPDWGLIGAMRTGLADAI